MKQISPDIDKLYELLHKQFEKTMLSKKEAALATGLSCSSLDRMRKSGIGPEYKKMPGKNNCGNVYYPLHGLVKFLIDGNIKTA